MYGKPRYDFAMVRFLDNDRTIKTAPAKVIGFIKYKVYTNTLFLRRVAANFAGDPKQ